MNDLRSTDSYDDLFLACMLCGPPPALGDVHGHLLGNSVQNAVFCQVLPHHVLYVLYVSVFKSLFCIANITVTVKAELKLDSLDAIMIK